MTPPLVARVVKTFSGNHGFGILEKHFGRATRAAVAMTTIFNGLKRKQPAPSAISRRTVLSDCLLYANCGNALVACLVTSSGS